MEENVKTIMQAGMALADAQNIPGHARFVVVPDGYKIHSLESIADFPQRKRAKVTMLDAESYIAYTVKHGSLDNCTHYADVHYELARCTVVGVIDDHGSTVEESRWREHTCTFSPKLSIEWNRWIVANGSSMTQSKFAGFIEDNIQDIVSVSGSVSGAQMLEMSLNFEQTSEKRFKRKIDLGNGGVQLEFVDKADDNTTSKMKVFDRFFIGIPVFQGSTDSYPLEARLKYRQNNDTLQFWFELIRPDRVFKTAVMAELKNIQEKTGFPLLFGNAGLA